MPESETRRNSSTMFGVKHTIWSAATFQCLFVLVVAAGCGGGDSQPEPSNDAGVISDAGQTFECGSQALRRG